MRIALLLLCAATLAATGCGRQQPSGRLKVGYVVNYMSHEWYQNICTAARERAAALGVDLVIADANLDVAAQISKAENLIAQGVRVLILTPVDAKALDPLVRQAKAAGLHVITESNPVPGSDTYVGIDNRESGKKAGRWYAEYARTNRVEPRVLVIGLPNFEDCRLRVAGFAEALAESGIAYLIVQEVDGQGLKEKAFKAAQDAPTAHPEVNAIFGINDDSSTGGMAAYKAAGLDESRLTVIGFGFEGTVGQTALLGHTPYKAALGMFPNFVGISLVEAAVALAEGKPLPDRYETPTTMITLDNFATYYRPEGSGYAMDIDAVRRLMRPR
jgi:ABC-type sugar transport system substrate-binding protein